MCGRYSQSKGGAELQARFDFEPTELVVQPRYNLAPTQDGPVVIRPESGPRSLELMRWGLLPHWAPDEKQGYRMINARAESVAEKPAFRGLLKKRRCLVLADGFYEWSRSADKKVKTPWRFTLDDGRAFSMAGLWSAWQNPAGEIIRTYTIITTSPNPLLAEIHDRMPVILPQEAEEAWLDPDLTDPAILTGLLEPYPAELMAGYQVSRAVNSVANEGPKLIDPAQPEQPGLFGPG